MKTSTLDEAQSMLPLVESLLKRAIENKQAAEEIETELSSISRRIHLAGGMTVNIAKIAGQRSAMVAVNCPGPQPRSTTRRGLATRMRPTRSKKGRARSSANTSGGLHEAQARKHRSRQPRRPDPQR